MVEKDVTHPRMKRRIENPRIILLDCPLEYKKAESATNLEVRAGAAGVPGACTALCRAGRATGAVAVQRAGPAKRTNVAVQRAGAATVTCSMPLYAQRLYRVLVPACALPADETLICAWTELRS
jgi:hypothetical protein